VMICGPCSRASRTTSLRRFLASWSCQRSPMGHTPNNLSRLARVYPKPAQPACVRGQGGSS
jgi:hypothetical protein